MNQNNDMELSSSLALTGLNVVLEDEGDYVFVAGDLDDDDGGIGLLDEWQDDESYDHCDLSPSLSCATSVATNVTLEDLNIIEDTMMMDIDNDGDEPTPMETEDARDEKNSTTRNFPSSSMVNPKNGRRLSNKKMRKKMKSLKKAAAAKVAAEALMNQKAGVSSWGSTEDMTRVASSHKSRKPASKRNSSDNLAVACAQETLAAYREEIEVGKVQKKTRAVSIDVP